MSGSNSNPLEDVLNVATQWSTLGLVGYDKKGFKAGVTGEPIVEGTKEITGAAAAEEANAMAREQFEQQTAAANQDRENAKIANQRANLTASQTASAARNISTKNNKKSSSTPIGDVTDFLGI